MKSGEFPRQYARTRRFSLGVPRAFRVAPDGSRVTFLRSAAGDDAVNRLWAHDLSDGEARIVADPIELLGDSDALHLPPEERARRERAREAGGGIVSYSTDDAVTRAVFALAGRLYSTDLASGETARLPAVDGVFDPRPDPTGALVAYVAAGDLYVTSLESGDRLLAGSEDPDVTYGTAEFIAAEEMRRTQGYWWGPDGEWLLVSRVDVSSVPRWYIASPIHPDQPPRSIRYPAAGSGNAEVRLELHNLRGGAFEVDWNPSDEWEYLAKASWAPRTTPTLIVQTRDQRRCAILEVNPSSGECSLVYEWVNDKWIDIVPGAPLWVGSDIVTVEDAEGARRLMMGGHPLTGDHLQVREVIQGDTDGILIVASTEPSEAHLHHVALDGTVTQLTEQAGIHGAVTAGRVTVVTRASLDAAGPQTTVLRDGATVGTIESLAETPTVEVSVDLHRFGSDKNVCTAVLLPAGANRDTPLPVLVDPYGGPHAQRVVKAANAHAVSQWFANQGFFVVVTDGRGTPGQHPDFERSVWGDLAQPVLDDQVMALEQLASEYPGMDLDRVGIRGWSFGGYLAALAVLRRPDRFHAAIAGAPVTDWRLYDTHYTERYLGHPDKYPEHYHRTDLTAEAGSLSRPLLLIHGLADDNVVAAHTLKLSEALLATGRAHQVLPLSDVTHMTPQQVVAENLLLLQLAFLQDALEVT